MQRGNIPVCTMKDEQNSKYIQYKYTVNVLHLGNHLHFAICNGNKHLTAGVLSNVNASEAGEARCDLRNNEIFKRLRKRSQFAHNSPVTLR